MYDEQKKQSLETARLKDQQRKKELAEKQTKQQEEQNQARQRLVNAKQKKQKEKKKTRLVKFSDIVFVLALIAALLKDILDFIQFTGIGYAFVIIMTILIFIFIAFMVLLGILTEGPKLWIKISLALIGGTATEILPGIGLLPITMGVVAGIYVIVIRHRSKNIKLLSKAETPK